MKPGIMPSHASIMIFIDGFFELSSECAVCRGAMSRPPFSSQYARDEVASFSSITIFHKSESRRYHSLVTATVNNGFFTVE